MKRIEMTVLSDDTNASVVQLPHRKFPGIVVQGDTLSTIVRSFDEVVEALNDQRSDDALAAAEQAREIIRGLMHAYESTMAAAGLPLPYVRRARS